VRVRETMPDAVLNDADEVVLIDLTPEALLDRLRAGKIYPNERIDSALNNFFRIENLNALREVALRQVAEEVESKRLVREVVGQREDRMVDVAASQAVGEKLLALVKPTPRSQRLVRRAWRSAQRLAADLDLLYVKRPGQKLSEDEQQQLKAIHRLASVLGARLLVEEGDDLVQTVRDVAEERGSTYLLIGTPSPRTGLNRFRPSMATRLIESLPGVDIRIVADRTLRAEEPD
jgi:two-component system, OmpR family, sensor histidine kinase KdpD